MLSKENVDRDQFFTLSGHSKKIYKQQTSKTGMGQKFFSQSVIDEWNQLPENESFTKRLDRTTTRSQGEMSKLKLLLNVTNLVIGN